MKFIWGLQYNCAKNLCELCWDYEEKLRSLLIQSSDDQAVTWMKWIKVDNFSPKARNAR